MIGNAVPSLLAEVLAREIRYQLLGDRTARDTLKLLPPVRTPVPKPEPVLPLAEKYHHLIGEHPDHPGERRSTKKSVRSKAERQSNLFDSLPALG